MTTPQPVALYIGRREGDEAGVLLDFNRSMVLPRRAAWCALYVARTKTDVPLTFANARFVYGSFPVPLPGRFWRRRFYSALCWHLGRAGR